MITAIIQARMSSSRLPGKVLLPLLGQPMLARQVERTRRARELDAIVVATSTDPSDDPIAACCSSRGIAYERGSLDDVLDRYYQTALKGRPDRIVRLTADCPLIDPRVIDAVVAFAVTGRYDYASNTIESTFPDGLDVEVFTFSALETAWQEALLPSEREHVTPYLKNAPGIRRGNFRGDKDLSHHRWTVDEPEDFALIEQVFEALYPEQPDFGLSEIIALLARRPELARLNAQFVRDKGYRNSLAADRSHGAR